MRYRHVVVSLFLGSGREANENLVRGHDPVHMYCSVMALAVCRVAAGRRLAVVKLYTYEFSNRFDERDIVGGWRAACLCNGG